MKPLTPDELRQCGMALSKTFDREQQDLETYVVTARALLQAAESLAAAHPEERKGYLGIAMNTSFNIAAACWPGWEDAHESIPPELLALGLELARFNVRTAEDIDAPPERRFNGFWIRGVHELAATKYDDATRSFELAAEQATHAETEDTKLMAEGWLTVTSIMAHHDGNSPQSLDASLSDTERQLEALGDDGKFYAGQFRPAIERLNNLR